MEENILGDLDVDGSTLIFGIRCRYNMIKLVIRK
jgi:hypothetical protein